MGMSGWRAYQPSAAFKAAISCGPGRHYPCYSGTIVVHSQAPVAQGHTELTTTPPAALTSAGHISLASLHRTSQYPLRCRRVDRTGRGTSDGSISR